MLEKIEIVVLVVPAAAIAKYPGQLANTGVEMVEISVLVKVSPITLTSDVSLPQAIIVSLRPLLFTCLILMPSQKTAKGGVYHW